MLNLDRNSKLEPPNFYPYSIDVTCLSLSLEINAMQGVVVCDNACHNLTSELTSSLFIYFHILNQIDNYIAYNLRIFALINYNFIFKEINSNMVERRARDLNVRGLSSCPVKNFSSSTSLL